LLADELEIDIDPYDCMESCCLKLPMDLVVVEVEIPAGLVSQEKIQLADGLRVELSWDWSSRWARICGSCMAIRFEFWGRARHSSIGLLAMEGICISEFIISGKDLP